MTETYERLDWTTCFEVVAEETLRVVGAASVSVCRWEREHGVGRALINVGDLGPSEERYPLDEVYPLADFPLDVALLERGEPYLSAFNDPDNDDSEREMLARQRKSSYLALLFCDVDGLKQINDTHGHKASDRVLTVVAEVLAEVGASGPDRVVGRIGGDEFCVVLGSEGIDAARLFAAEACRRLAGRALGATFSCVAASIRIGAGRPADLFRAADAAQYAAKRAVNGRWLTRPRPLSRRHPCALCRPRAARCATLSADARPRRPARRASGRGVLRRVAVVKGERIAVRVLEERLVADAGVECVRAERDAA